MDQPTSRTTYTVEVTGAWLDPRTQEEAPHTETFRVLAGLREAAETAGVQLFGSAAAKERCRALDGCEARAG